MSSYNIPRGVRAVVNTTDEEAVLISGYTEADNGAVILNLEELKLRRYDHATTSFIDLGGGNVERTIRATVAAGNIAIGDNVLEDKTLTEFIEQLIAPTTYPTKQNNSVIINGLSSSKTVEVGTTVKLDLSTTYNRGTIYSTNGSPSVPLTGVATLAVYFGPGTIAGNKITYIAVSGTAKWSVEQDFAQETSPYFSSDGEPSTLFDSFRGPSPSISNPAQAITVNGITGKYKYWWSAGSIPTTSTAVRSLSDEGFYPVGSFDIAIPEGVKPVAFYIPDVGATVQVVHVESSFNDVTSNFTVVPMVVEDANGVGIDYLRYEYTIPGIGYTADATFRVSIT